MFAGYVDLGGTFEGGFLTRTAGELLVAPDDLPRVRVRGPGDAELPDGTASAIGDDPGWFRYLVVAAGPDGYEVGQAYRVLIDWQVDGETFAEQQVFLVT